jgi:Cd2+/Zn2+-exporting ATPase
LVGWIFFTSNLMSIYRAYLSYLGLLSVVIGIPPIANKAFRTARRGMIDTNVLMFLAVVGAVCLQQFDEAAAVTFLFSMSEWLEDRATSRANAALTSIVNLKPERANIIQPKTKELVVVPATSVPVGAMVAVKSGDKIPCDGVIAEGTSTVDESSLTGESRPVKKGPGDEVSGGTVNSGNTQIVVQTTRTSDDSAVSRLIRLVEEAQANRSETEKIVDSFAKVYTPVVVISAISMCTIPWLWGDEIGRDWMARGLSLLVIACPCALVISTPISYVAGLAATAQNGILVKGGAHLEALGQLKHVCFDKTGTLTVGDFKLLKLDVIGKKNKRNDVLPYLALMEDRATHPLAKSLVDGIKAEGVTIPTSLFVKDHTFLAGEGVMGMINDSKVYVGNERLFRRLGIFESIPLEQRKEVESWEAMGGTIGFMSIGNHGVVCAYCVADAPRPEAAQVLKELKSMGINVTMLTGDKKETALSIGKKIGLAEGNIKSELLPEEKLALVSEMKIETEDSNPLLALFFSKPRLVLMCGDGVNDAPSLVAANVGVAMGAGAALAMETADVTLMDSHLTKLTYSIKMGRSVIGKIRQNVVFSIVVKLAVLTLTLMNKVGLWAAIGSDVGSMIIVTLNGMSLLPNKRATNKGTASSSSSKITV